MEQNDFREIIPGFSGMLIRSLKFKSVCSIAAFWVWGRLGLGIVAASDGSRRTDS